MTLKKSSRAGLIALAFGILLGIILSVGVYDTSYAQAPAPGAAAAPPRRRSGGTACAAAGLRQRSRIRRRPCSRSARRIRATPPGCSPQSRSC